MKIYLIKASAGSQYSKYKAETGGPPQNIFSAAAATPSHIDIAMCDETIGMKADLDSDADLVVIFMSTPDAYRAYEIADAFYQKDKVVALGGLHTMFNQVEAMKHAHCLLLGEVENYWETFLDDVENHQLKPKYESKEAVDLSTLNPYPTDLIPVSRYNYTWSVVVTRGCPHRCDFCLVHKFFDKFQLRPIQNIVDELWSLKALGVEWVELHSDNLTQNKDYALELFEALEPLEMSFYGETTILIARDEELLMAAKKAGVKSLLFGIETPSAEALKAQGKAFVKPAQIKEYVAKVKSYGITVFGDFLFGFDEHDEHIFQETLDFVKMIKVDRVYPHLVIPFPGSDTFKKLDEEGRILTKDWSKYEGGNVVYQPIKLNPEDLEEGLWWFWEQNASFWDKIKYSLGY
jgi:radical SAM superfamily enzyme YgiQ (UPF0313 family)